MDWVQPYYPAIAVPVILLLWWFHRGSLRPMSRLRRRVLLAVRAALVVITLLALAAPAWEEMTDRQTVLFILDHSQSQGPTGIRAAHARAGRLAAGLPASAYVGFLSAGDSTVVRQVPAQGVDVPEPDESLLETDGAQSDLASAVALASGLFPPGTSRRLVLVGDGQQTRGDLEAAARDAALLDVVIDAAPIAGQRRPDVRVARLVSSKSRSHEGASVELRADLESSLDGEGVVRLFENGVEVESRPLQLSVGQQTSEVFRVVPESRDLYTYRVRVEGFPDDTIHENDEAMTLVDVRGRPLLLYVEGEAEESQYLAEAMAKEGIRLQTRPAETFPQTLQELAGYDGVVLSDVPAHKLTEQSMTIVRDYVEKLGGGFVMIGGKSSFGVGGYYRTPIEDILPVKMKAPDKEERFATALALVIDRSGSMSGQKIEICKSAAVATVDLLSSKDYVCVVSFDSAARVVVPMSRVTSKSTINGQIATLNSGGGTNMLPGMTTGREALAGVTAKVRHMIVLSDGQTRGGGYQALAAQMQAEGMTISTVAVGAGSHVALLQSVATAGGGQFYQTIDPTNLPRIFTQDAMVHMGRLIREESFAPKQVERHLMLEGCPLAEAPALLGYVKTNRKATAQVPLVTDLADPLLAHWQFGLGKVTAFTSDCKSRWAALWITGWPSYNQFWAQVLRETARKPQSQTMDIRLQHNSPSASILVDVLEDPAHFKNDASVVADVYFVAAGSLGSSMEQLEQLTLQQTGPGRYRADFLPDEAGVYLVRARAGAEVVSAGLVHNRSGETATGRVDRPLLENVCRLTGGRVLPDSEDTLPPIRAGHAHFVELTPLLLKLLLLLFMVDVAVRRWENVQGILSLFSREKRG
ncbi:MAG: VWA domain-containing protein [Pirellulales bacterium]|nr:VWA domain-containing protein [Pirellulales bacterium]